MQRASGLDGGGSSLGQRVLRGGGGAGCSEDLRPSGTFGGGSGRGGDWRAAEYLCPVGARRGEWSSRGCRRPSEDLRPVGTGRRRSRRGCRRPSEDLRQVGAGRRRSRGCRRPTEDLGPVATGRRSRRRCRRPSENLGPIRTLRRCRWRRTGGMAAEDLGPVPSGGGRRGIGRPEGRRRRDTRRSVPSGTRSPENLRAGARRWGRRRRLGWRVRRRPFARAIGDEDMTAPGALDGRPTRRHQSVIECVVRLALRAADLHDSGPYHASGLGPRWTLPDSPPTYPTWPWVLPRAQRPGFRRRAINREHPRWRRHPGRIRYASYGRRARCISRARRSSP